MYCTAASKSAFEEQFPGLTPSELFHRCFSPSAPASVKISCRYTYAPQATGTQYTSVSVEEKLVLESKIAGLAAQNITLTQQLTAAQSMYSSAASLYNTLAASKSLLDREWADMVSVLTAHFPTHDGRLTADIVRARLRANQAKFEAVCAKKRALEAARNDLTDDLAKYKRSAIVVRRQHKPLCDYGKAYGEYVTKLLVKDMDRWLKLSHPTCTFDDNV